jgi:hypothetical protein
VSVTADETYTALYAPKHAPPAENSSATTPESTPVATPLSASDVDGDALTYAIVVSPAHGTLSGGTPTLQYTPNAGYSGPDSFTFRANDGIFDSNVATVSILVTHVNRPPLCPNASFTTPQGKALTKTLVCTDPESSPLTYSAVGATTHGSLSLASSGTFTYTPVAGYVGPDSFTYKANDGSLDSNVATVTIGISDTRPPTCSFTGMASDSLGRPMYKALLQDGGSGLASIRVSLALNALVKLPAFTVGTTKQQIVYQTVIGDPSNLELDVHDVAGNRTVCDPLIAKLAITRTVRAGAKPSVRVFVGVPREEATLEIRNGKVGLSRIEIVVNGHLFALRHLRSREVRRVSLAPAMLPGNANSVTIRGFGGRRAAAVVALGN